MNQAPDVSKMGIIRTSFECGGDVVVDELPELHEDLRVPRVVRTVLGAVEGRADGTRGRQDGRVAGLRRVRPHTAGKVITWKKID